MTTDANRRARRAATALRLSPKRLLYDAVLQRMEGNDNEASTRAQERDGCIKPSGKCIKLAIDGNA